MTANQIKVRRKSLPATRQKSRYLAIGAWAIIFAAAAISIWAFSGGFNAPSQSPEAVVETQQIRSVIRVPAGGDLQAAINRARGGDTVELQAGATYYGRINLPVKQTADFITIQSSAAAKLPENRRVSPSDAKLMAKIATRGAGEPAVSAEYGAHHYRFVGIEFAPGSSDYIYNLILFGAGEAKVADVPRDLEIDRCYLHPFKTGGVTRRAVALNSANTIIKNSYFEGFAFPGEETQAIGGWTGTKNAKIINNYIEAGAENILIGGSDPVSADLVPSDIEIRNNLLFKPPEWTPKNTVKTLFEIKNGRRIQLTGNVLENSPTGSAFRITVRNQDGAAPFSTIEDVLIKDNIIANAAQGINILGKDDTFPSQTLKRLQIVNNIFYKIEPTNPETNSYFVQIADGEDVLIANNTVFQTGNLTTFYGVMPRNFVFRDNIVGHGEYGIHGHSNIKSPLGQRFFRNNVIVNNKQVGAGDTSFPAGNFWINSFGDVGFVDLNGKNFRLAAPSRFKGKGADKTDIGANVENIAATMPEELFKRILR